jgi:cytochrome o ubiquinol oxidase operon protein cyoD
MSDPHHPEPDPLAHPEVQQASSAGYVMGYALTVALLGIGLFATHEESLPPMPLLVALSILAVFLLLAQAMTFFGLNFSRYHVWKTVSLVLTVPLFILSIGLTVWMFHALDNVTMMPEMPGMSIQPTTLQ